MHCPFISCCWIQYNIFEYIDIFAHMLNKHFHASNSFSIFNPLVNFITLTLTCFVDKIAITIKYAIFDSPVYFHSG